MNKTEFILALQDNNINPNIVCFNDSVQDDIFCVVENYNKVDIFYRERGNIFDLRSFENLSDGLTYLLNRLLKITVKP